MFRNYTNRDRGGGGGFNVQLLGLDVPEREREGETVGEWERKRERRGGIDWLQGFWTHIRIGFTSFPAHLRCHPSLHSAQHHRSFGLQRAIFTKLPFLSDCYFLLVSSGCECFVRVGETEWKDV